MGTWSIKDAVSNVPPEDQYVIRIDSIATQVAKSSGDTGIVFKGKIVQGELDGQNYYSYFSLAPQAIWNIANQLNASQQFDPEESLPDEAEELATILGDHLVNKLFLAECAHSEYQGKTRANWTILGPVSNV